MRTRLSSLVMAKCEEHERKFDAQETCSKNCIINRYFAYIMTTSLATLRSNFKILTIMRRYNRPAQPFGQSSSTYRHHSARNQSSNPRQYRPRAAPQPPPAPPIDPLSQYQFDEISIKHLKTLDIYPQMIDELSLPGKAVCYLTQIITIADNQLQNVGGFHFETKSIESYWVGFLTINFPERRTFTCKHKTKKECKNLCALAAIYHLRKNNAIDPSLKVNIDTSVTTSFIDSIRGPVAVNQIPMNIKQQMMSFTNKFDEYIYNLLDYQVHEAKRRFGRYDVGGIEGKHATILEGLEPDECIGTNNNMDPTDTLPTNGPVDIFTGRLYVQPDQRKKINSFATLRKVFEDKMKKYQSAPYFKEMLQSQERLPIRSNKDKVIETLRERRAIVVAGDTGSGKSTQVPQFILEEFLNYESNANSFVNIAVTQPRRISAISLAERVAIELGESASGHTVGHNVRFDTKTPGRDMNIVSFFTTGMLLRRMQQNPDLKGVSHLIIDEVHERDCATDFLLILVKRLLARRKDLKVIFMSASMDAGLFSRYFDNCPIVSVSGRSYPVNDQYLENICQNLRIDMPRGEYFLRAPKLNVNLLVDLVKYIDSYKSPGAILCFMPGWKEIKAVHKELEYCKSTNRLRVFPMHSKLPISDQRLIFRQVDNRERKVILATNIAETSITINDVKYVIDTGLCNSIDYDAELNMSTLGARWISKANAKQRSGRAGRTSPGECFKLYTREEESHFQEFPSPELLRIPLESVIMEAKCHCPEERAASFLSQAIQHPSIGAIHSAIDELMLLGVLDSREDLTVLGKRISGLSTHPRVSISLVAASALRCLYPVLNSSACLSSTQEPFLSALTEKSIIRNAKERLCCDAISTERDQNLFMSDHIAFANLIAQYDNAINSQQELEFLITEHNLNRSSMAMIQECRNLNARMMILANFVSNFEWYSFDSLPNRDMNELDVMIAALTFAFYPKIVRIIRGKMKNGRMYHNQASPTDVQSNVRVRFASDSIVKNISIGRQLNSMVREEGSVDSDEDSDYVSMSDVGDARKPTFITYMNSRADQDAGVVVIRDGSIVPPLTLLIFGGREFAVHEISSSSSRSEANRQNPQDDNLVNVTLDRYGLLSFKISRDDARALQEWRRVWQLYFDWYVHTRNTSEPVDPNDSIIGGTMNEFLELNKKLYASTR